MKIAALLLAAAAPAKLVIVSLNAPAAVTDYPSMARCERALRDLDRQQEKTRAESAPQAVRGGGFIYTPTPPPAKLYCIPG